jgi:hypothetical protein
MSERRSAAVPGLSGATEGAAPKERPGASGGHCMSDLLTRARDGFGEGARWRLPRRCGHRGRSCSGSSNRAARSRGTAPAALADLDGHAVRPVNDQRELPSRRFMTRQALPVPGRIWPPRRAPGPTDGSHAVSAPADRLLLHRRLLRTAKAEPHGPTYLRPMVPVTLTPGHSLLAGLRIPAMRILCQSSPRVTYLA